MSKDLSCPSFELNVALQDAILTIKQTIDQYNSWKTSEVFEYENENECTEAESERTEIVREIRKIMNFRVKV